MSSQGSGFASESSSSAASILPSPELQANELTGAAARALHAQSNAWEAVSVFGVAVVIAHLAGADAETSAVAAIVFVVARIFRAIFYVGDRPPLRTASFVVGMLCCLTLFGLAIRA